MSATETVSLIEGTPLTELPVEHLFDMSVDLEPAQPIATQLGALLVYVAKGGRIEGPGLEGELLPGGGDWLWVGADQVGRVDVRAMIRTDDGALIHYTAGGIIDVPADSLTRLAAGERLPWNEIYMRTTPRFETSDERYAWLSKLVMIGYNELSPNHVDYRIYRVR
jgi:hypothetical protein